MVSPVSPCNTHALTSYQTTTYTCKVMSEQKPLNRCRNAIYLYEPVVHHYATYLMQATFTSLLVKPSTPTSSF